MQYLDSELAELLATIELANIIGVAHDRMFKLTFFKDILTR
jgi:hypothetical protein